MQNLLFALSITLPIILMLALGMLLRYQKRVDKGFIKTGNDLVFSICLPAMLFLSTATNHISESFSPELIGLGVSLTIVSIAILSALGRRFMRRSRLRVFVQGGFRGNLGIIGVAMVINTYGEEVLPKVGVFFAVLTLLYNLCAVLILGGSQSWLNILKQLLANPLIKAILAGALWSGLGLPVPVVMETTLSYLSSITLPLALICIGAGLEYKSFKTNLKPVLLATFYKLVGMPTIAVIACIILGLQGEDLGIMFLMMAAPSAAASYVMANKMTDQGAMAGEIVVLSTLASALTTGLGLYVLASFDLLGI